MSAAERLTGLPPLIGPESRVLILGSFPSAASLAAQQYYAHRQNQFWKILGAVLGQPLHEMDYAAKQAAVLAAGLAIWDVYASCERAGSLDSAIRNGMSNDFAKLKKSALAGRHDLPRVCFNGQAAGRFAPQLEMLGFKTVILPSTSPANASWSFERKLAAWRAALKLE
ncbi:MAG: DNA-deoxyinosine glycosylase [Pseudomonadota bacterium]